ncbi:bifunctional riboflavin kinase/FAD synthetase [Campylobacter sp. RM9344]|uniref:Riboflavin biosynthesis protein n=1 Tax=Campylobacter californiensis TaxID=1032243 RepID=A0AAW3ZUK9_9BACT|nr:MULTISPECIES: bifunctional riboflavin kinase/FAD synthetase [unclassified Campylobacter]MBE2984783.1 bifunctional riboflavin kinase/FAD synthetase [Campylobacter sp. RM6883]MBE2986487.1 bifunctional riboflavin kinase/FAD synthetase [Campylobacter sp. RM12919]MBE2987687.1 bifunctional riboflavin kinase/FAD synthetase [Campylobacter sp. RM12920]MBE2994751.1 bifunctional riboflavin kinase/FAD synthetase [Campylobacter sp. RM6913]MBE3022335.1 bifunctional riboflavin kinase/FAD synthetase [Campy
MPNFSTLLTKDNITAVAIGHFDGIHRGHKQLLKRLGQYGGLVIIDKNKANITPKLKRAEYSSYPCFLYDFESIKGLSGEEFIALLKRDFKNLKKIVVGFDFRFGRNRAWDKRDLMRIFDGEVDVVDEYCFNEMGVHSSTIREYIKDGKIAHANALLGREYSIEGDVVKGQGIGAKELVPTLNLRIQSYLLPKAGVYATRTRIGYKTYGSVTFVGNRVSTDGAFSVETHIIGEEVHPSAERIAVCFVKALRENKKFNSLAELKEQIKKDIEQAKQFSGVCELFLMSQK